jgi:DNA-binding HxlR family transcriptional regulator
VIDKSYFFGSTPLLLIVVLGSVVGQHRVRESAASYCASRRPPSRRTTNPSLIDLREIEEKTVKGITFFEPGDSALLHALQNPRVNIAGIRRADLLAEPEMFSPNRFSRHLRRLRDLGVIKRVTGTSRYYLTKAGRAATAAIIIPAMIRKDFLAQKVSRTRR